MMQLFNKLLRYKRFSVLLDGRDNSITFSHSLYKEIEKRHIRKGETHTIVFNLPKANNYAFAIDPLELKGVNTQMSEIQYNPLYKSVGFESLCPTVNKILFDYGLPYDKPVKLKVFSHTLLNGMVYYEICRPVKK